MVTTGKVYVLLVLSLAQYPISGTGQEPDSIWTLNRCIEYALQKNISVQKTTLSHESERLYLEQTKAGRFPSVNASASENFGWEREMNGSEYGSYTGSYGSNFGINSNVRIYNGLKLKNSIEQSALSYKAGQYDVETVRESVSLSILNAYLQILYADEQVKNSENQIASTSEQLRLAEERLNLGAISKSDYLMVKSELASEKLALANAQSLSISYKVNLMQLMELPVASTFRIDQPDFGTTVLQERNAHADSVYLLSLVIKPQVKSAELNRQIADLNVAIAKAAYQPSLSLSGGLSTGYSSRFAQDFGVQVGNKINPSLGLALSIPIYQNKQASTGVALAKISSKTAELDELNTRNQLRKEIEQVCSDVLSAEKKYEASVEQYSATQEAYSVAEEKYNVGMMNSVDFILQKTKLINAESELLQSKYNLVFSYKILDFYLGIPLSF